MPERTGCNLRCNASEVCFYALVTVDPSMWNLNNQLENAIYPLINGFVGYIFQGQRLNCMFAHDDNKLIHGVGCHATNQRLVTDGNQMKRNLAQAVHAVHSPTGKALWVFVSGRRRAGYRNHFKLLDVNLSADDIFNIFNASSQQEVNWLID